MNEDLRFSTCFADSRESNEVPVGLGDTVIKGDEVNVNLSVRLKMT